MPPSILPPPLPPVLRDVQAIVRGHWRVLGEELYREIARTLEVGPGGELIVVGCGDGVTVEWLAGRTGALATGVDADPERIARAERRSRTAAKRLSVSFEAGSLEDLPHEGNVFDASLGEPLLAATPDPERAVAELVRVTKPMGVVVLLQLTWSSGIADSTRALLVERLGLRPHHLVEWKQMLRDAGVVDVDVQDWSEGPLGRSPRLARPGQRGRRRPASGWTPQLSLPQKVHIVGRAWKRWGWRAGVVDAARGALARERELLLELSRERAIGFQLIRGVKWPHARTERRPDRTR
jgi:SAM-dependent methyltransferase